MYSLVITLLGVALLSDVICCTITEHSTFRFRAHASDSVANPSRASSTLFFFLLFFFLLAESRHAVSVELLEVDEVKRAVDTAAG